jgi:hypothetical protein
MGESTSEKRGRSSKSPDTKKARVADGATPVSKTAEIRKVAKRLVAQGKPPRPKDIVLILERAGITVTGAQVSTALANTEFAFRRNRDGWERPQVLFPEPALAFQLVGLEDVQMAKEFVDQIGSLEKAMAALVALQQFGGGKPRVDSPGPVIESCRIVPEKKAKPKPADEEPAAES